MQDNIFLRRSEAAAYLQRRCGAYTKETLAKLACVGGGPRFQKLGPFPVYLETDLEDWLKSRLSMSVLSTSELTTAPAQEAA